jgi:hypothetical protein
MLLLMRSNVRKYVIIESMTLAPNFNLPSNELLSSLLPEILLELKQDFKWHSPQTLYTTILTRPEISSYINISDSELVYQIHRDIYKIAITQWGLAPLDFKIIDYNPSLDAPSLDKQFKLWEKAIEPVFHQRWITPNTYNNISQASSTDPHTRTVNDYVLSIAKARIDTPRYESTLTISALKATHQPRRPGNYSPLYDALSGAPSPDPTLFTAGGEPIWSTKTSSPGEFQSALHYATTLMQKREDLDIISTLNSHAKHV